MIAPHSLKALYSYRHPLLLQGPIGPFFSYLNERLTEAGAEVRKINFNAGDAFFYRKSSSSYAGCPNDFEHWFVEYIAENAVDVIVLFGEHRGMHVVARKVAESLGLPVFVFEEGYVRPHYSTLEYHGVNASSLLPQSPSVYLNCNEKPMRCSPIVGSYFTAARLCVIYYLWSWVFSYRFAKYKHHRSFNPFAEGARWLGSWVRKWISKVRDRRVERFLIKDNSQQYFLVPLQVHSDSQIIHHSDYESVEQFIIHVIEEFSVVAAKEQVLVFKHHPMDRAYTNYTQLLKQLERRYSLKDRIFYIDECWLPRLLDHAAGIVVVNSTVGLSGLLHKRPVKVMGRAIYNMEGLADQQPLAGFFKSPHLPNAHLVKKFIDKLIVETQLNCNFYQPTSYHLAFPLNVEDNIAPEHSLTLRNQASLSSR